MPRQECMQMWFGNQSWAGAIWNQNCGWQGQSCKITFQGWKMGFFLEAFIYSFPRLIFHKRTEKPSQFRVFFVLVSTFPFPRKAIIMIIKYPSDETFQKWPKCKKVPWAILAHFPQTVEWLLNIFSIFGSFFQSWRDPHRYGRPSWGLRHRCPF